MSKTGLKPLFSNNDDLPTELDRESIVLMPQSFIDMITPHLFDNPLTQETINKVHAKWKLRMFLLGRTTLKDTE